MEFAADWYNSEKKVYEVRCTQKDTVLFFNLDKYQFEIIKKLDNELKFKFVVCKSMTDLLALPAFFCVLNTDGISKMELDKHFDFMVEWLDDCPYLFTDYSKQFVLGTFPNTSIVIRTQPHFNKNFLKSTIKSFHLSAHTKESSRKRL